MELLQQERDRASSVIGLWYKMLKATWEREKGAKLHTNNPNAIGPETAHAINMVKRYKQLKEVQFKLKRAEGDFGDAVAESGVSLSDKMANLKTATIGAGTENHQGLLAMNTEMRARVRAIEETQATILAKVTQLTEKQRGGAAAVPPLPVPAPGDD